MLVTVLLLGLVLVATATDLFRQKIYNWTTYPGILAAWGLSAVEGGFGGFAESFCGFLVCGLLMLVCYAMFRIGGGDVKLIAMIGAFLGWQQGITAMLWTFVLGGCMGLIVLIWRVGPLRLASGVFRQIVYSLRLGSWSPLAEQERKELQPPLFLSPCALAAVVIVRFGLGKAFL